MSGAPRQPPGRPTARELAILAAVAEGRSNAEIGRRLGISPQTVKSHVSALLHRLGVPDRTAAVVRALQQNWLDLNALQVAERTNRTERGRAGRSAPAPPRPLPSRTAARHE